MTASSSRENEKRPRARARQRERPQPQRRAPAVVLPGAAVSLLAAAAVVAEKGRLRILPDAAPLHEDKVKTEVAGFFQQKGHDAGHFASPQQAFLFLNLLSAAEVQQKASGAGISSGGDVKQYCASLEKIADSKPDNTAWKPDEAHWFLLAQASVENCVIEKEKLPSLKALDMLLTDETADRTDQYFAVRGLSNAVGAKSKKKKYIALLNQLTGSEAKPNADVVSLVAALLVSRDLKDVADSQKTGLKFLKEKVAYETLEFASAINAAHFVYTMALLQQHATDSGATNWVDKSRAVEQLFIGAKEDGKTAEAKAFSVLAMQTAEKTGLVNTEEFFTIRTVATATKKVQLAVAPVLVSAAGGKKMDLSSITAVKDKTVKFVKGKDTTEYGENTFEAKISPAKLDGAFEVKVGKKTGKVTVALPPVEEEAPKPEKKETSKQQQKEAVNEKAETTGGRGTTTKNKQKSEKKATKTKGPTAPVKKPAPPTGSNTPKKPNPEKLSRSRSTDSFYEAKFKSLSLDVGSKRDSSRNAFVLGEQGLEKDLKLDDTMSLFMETKVVNKKTNEVVRPQQVSLILTYASEPSLRPLGLPLEQVVPFTPPSDDVDNTNSYTLTLSLSSKKSIVPYDGLYELSVICGDKEMGGSGGGLLKELLGTVRLAFSQPAELTITQSKLDALQLAGRAGDGARGSKKNNARATSRNALASGDLKFYGPQEPIEHLFREPEKRPNHLIPAVFIVGVAAVFVLMAAVVLAKWNLRLLFHSATGIFFVGGLSCVVVLLWLFYLSLPLFVMATYLLPMFVVLLFLGNAELSACKETRHRLKVGFGTEASGCGGGDVAGKKE